MATYANDKIMDNGLNYLKNNGKKVVMLAGDPGTTYANTTNTPNATPSAGNMLGTVAITANDITVLNGDTSGRKATVAQQTGVSVKPGVTSGTSWDHVAVVDTVNSEILLVTPLSQAVSVNPGQTATVNAFDDEIADAS